MTRIHVSIALASCIAIINISNAHAHGYGPSSRVGRPRAPLTPVQNVVPTAVYALPDLPSVAAVNQPAPFGGRVRRYELGASLLMSSVGAGLLFEVAINPQTWWTLRLAVGPGAAHTRSSLLVAVRLPIAERVGVGYGLGASMGPYPSDVRISDVMVGWWNNELFAETRSDSALLRVFLSAGMPFTQKRECITFAPCTTGASLPTIVPTVGVAVAWHAGSNVTDDDDSQANAARVLAATRGRVGR